MGKNSILNKHQIEVLNAFSKEKELSSVFYFTGGTALSEYYLKHRQSVDLDFFSFEKFDPQIILRAINFWEKSLGFSVSYQFKDPTHIYILKFIDGSELKVDFAHYPYKQFEKPLNHKGVKVDSFFDISVNKFLTLTQRVEVKDFVDVYFIMKEFNIWQLQDGVKAKFKIEIDLYTLASDFSQVEDFEIMPKMIKNLSLEELKNFYKIQAKKLSKSAVY